MWAWGYIFTYLGNARDWFLSAYYTVSSWVYPFSLLATPIYYIYIAFYYVHYYAVQFNFWLTFVDVKIRDMIQMGDITRYFSTWITYATTAWQWVTNAWGNVTGIVNTWWSSAQQAVKVWINDAKYWLQAQIDSLSIWVSNLQASIAELLAQIPSINEILAWFRDWWAKILSPLTSWWNERLTEISALIRSELKDWFPFYDDLVNLWSSIKAFFVDPLGWLEAKFTDWFLGVE